MSLSWRSSPTLLLERYPLFSQATVLYIVYRGLSTYLWPTASRALLATLSSWSERLVGLAGYVPTPLVRWGIRIQLRHHLQQLKGKDVAIELAEKLAVVKELTDMPIAIHTDEANVQHYEVPAAFYDLCLGPCKKYSSGYWPDRHTTFAESERHMLQLYCDRAGVTDTGLHIVDLGCGWGSLTLYLAEQYPTTKITAISNSHSQREYILRTAKERNLNVANIQVVTVRACVRSPLSVCGWVAFLMYTI
jgi:cyclopropane-fatty-acyl-phospholipid synthase